ncbi:S-adenosylmethionine:tRNA ribosyltransferase-isomerase [Porphyridium purpureum]|uniref:S-adenosylmethionine:tRNA ribosyltransferase-isomerase n=1 Tax=Porphyridium purpureum TaxID=35688 RepID=A0A5J4YKB6_PORPP|nr:S-adenosylmethionine:tRNA ribosyltransferase-isomerase [Porphyridium purpureum]|eukprot:POR7587..scf210_14
MRVTRACASLLRLAQSLRASDFAYELPEARIAQRPLSKRAESKLLVWKKPSAHIQHERFDAITRLAPERCVLVLNETKVVRARLQLRKYPYGGKAEVMLLRPHEPQCTIAEALDATRRAQWTCLINGHNIGKGARLLGEILNWGLPPRPLRLWASVVEKGYPSVVQFHWEPNKLRFQEFVEFFGAMPLPMYMKRDADPSDTSAYQTVYGNTPGSVAAPTAGLHFDKSLLERIEKERGASIVRVCLHVGAGTFLPVKADTLGGHRMHEEELHVTRGAIDTFLDAKVNKRPVLAVGTTAVRTLESLYWFGVRLLCEPDLVFLKDQMLVSQWDPYRLVDQDFDSDQSKVPKAEEALRAVASYMDKMNLSALSGETQLLIAPPYAFQMVDCMITNFHEPKSTLLLLVAAFTESPENWLPSKVLADGHGSELTGAAGLTQNLRGIYDAALNNGYRFLSYGDTSFLTQDAFP